MNIKIHSIIVDDQNIDPSLWISVDIEHVDGIQVPLLIAGRLLLNGKTISNIHEVQIVNETYLKSIILDHNTFEDRINSGSKYQRKYPARLSASLSPKAIDYIEEVRDRHAEKSVHFQIEFILKTYTLSFKPVGTGGPQNTNEFSVINITKPFESFSITQSDWINKFARALDIGEFLLLETAIPNSHKVSEEWLELYDRLLLRVREMQISIRSGDWQKCMFAARQFYENLNFNEKKFPQQKELKEKLQQLFIDDQHSTDGFKNFYDGIINFFKFTSKFIHDKNNTDGQLNPLPIPYKEDCYFVFSLAIGVLNVIGRKVSVEHP